MGLAKIMAMYLYIVYMLLMHCLECRPSVGEKETTSQVKAEMEVGIEEEEKTSNRVFYWENDYLAQTSEENPEYRSIPVIEGEKVVVTCWVRATSNTEYRMTMYHDYHDASSSGMIKQVKDGVNHVKEVVNVNVVNSAAIDEQDIFCEINKPTEETISLLFKSFVIDDISVPAQVCDACEGKAKVTMKLKRPSKQRKEDDKFEKALKLKLKEQYGANEDEVEIDSEGIVTAKVNLNLLLNRDGVNKTKKVKDIKCQCTRCSVITETSQSVDAEVDPECSNSTPTKITPTPTTTATTTTTTTLASLSTCDQTWCRENCDNCGQGESNCPNPRKCDRECPCIDLDLICLNNNVSVTFDLSSLITRGYEVRSVELNLTEADTGEMLDLAQLEMEEKETYQYAKEGLSRPGSTLRACLKISDRKDVCRECRSPSTTTTTTTTISTTASTTTTASKTTTTTITTSTTTTNTTTTSTTTTTTTSTTTMNATTTSTTTSPTAPLGPRGECSKPTTTSCLFQRRCNNICQCLLFCQPVVTCGA